MVRSSSISVEADSLTPPGTVGSLTDGEIHSGTVGSPTDGEIHSGTVGL